MPSKRNPPPPPARILLVDDNNHGNVARKRLLEDQGLIVETALSGEEAYDMFLRNPFDLVVTDLKMTKMSGTELIMRLRGEDAKVPVILLSGFVECLGLTAEGTGADAVLNKSNNEAEHLARTVRQLLARKAARKPVASQLKVQTNVARSG